ncbi:MAG: hypothetical protein HEQ38_04875 [Gemmatimonas sp.]|nr:hypothetical protein [Gemmatimonas sp.]
MKIGKVTKSMASTYADLQDATEFGAEAVALLVAAKVYGAMFHARSYKGSGFDFYLTKSSASSDPNDIFCDAWALETSGILEGGPDEIRARIRVKRKQVAQAAREGETWVAVVEFSKPCAIFERQ